MASFNLFTDQTTNEKVAKLPSWAREMITRLYLMPKNLADETARLRKENEALKERNNRLKEQVEAMCEMFKAAARNGNDYAKVVVSILEGYEIFQFNNKSDS